MNIKTVSYWYFLVNLLERVSAFQVFQEEKAWIFRLSIGMSATIKVKVDGRFVHPAYQITLFFFAWATAERCEAPKPVIERGLVIPGRDHQAYQAISAINAGVYD